MSNKRPNPATEPLAEAAKVSGEALDGRLVVVVMPAYNAAKTLERTYHDIPHGIVSKIILVDDVSKDDTRHSKPVPTPS